MARSDLLLSLVKAGVGGDQFLFRKAVEALIAEERGKHHDILADRLAEHLQSNGHLPSLNGALAHAFSDLWFERIPQRSLEEFIFPEEVTQACREVIEEQQRTDLLRTYQLVPRNRILLAGEPGNGKTSLAEVLAHGLMVPLISARYEGLIASYLGETASRLKKLFDYVRTRPCVLFFDEFDTIGKERGDIHETGEIKRVVSSLLLQVDDLPSYVVVVTATNHPELLDRAVWRRFQLRLELPRPTTALIEEFLRRSQERIKIAFEVSLRTLADKLSGASYAEVEDFIADIARRFVLESPNANVKKIVNQRVAQWHQRFQPK
jgi:SpoVK/Ycf46/Vps4 family AAA+-type ATPase